MDTPDLINGIFSIIFVSISIITGSLIISKYFKYKQKSIIFVGMTWIGLTSLWMAKSISLLYELISGNQFDLRLFMFIGNFFIPITVLIWLLAFTDLVFKPYKKYILLVFTIYGLLMEIYFLFFLIVDPNHLGTFIPPIDEDYNLILTIYHASMVVFILVTGFLIGRISIKSENREIILKGKLMILSTFSFFLGGIFEILSYLDITIMIIGKLILILSAFLYYNAWMLPNWVKKIILKEKKVKE
ncbi:MAG: hypothetical protein JXA99_14345 [Candidatus Lokiarchaeota archaeon]|nr:hypothetical protein [Candidatus Lokiarchaeota archaeon]